MRSTSPPRLKQRAKTVLAKTMSCFSNTFTSTQMKVKANSTTVTIYLSMPHVWKQRQQINIKERAAQGEICLVGKEAQLLRRAGSLATDNSQPGSGDTRWRGDEPSRAFFCRGKYFTINYDVTKEDDSLTGNIKCSRSCKTLERQCRLTQSQLHMRISNSPR